MAISGFTFAHNALAGGYPIREAIEAVRPYVDEILAVDMQSTDETRELLESMCDNVISGEWGNEAGKTLAKAHSLHTKCQFDTILHFEADEVYDDSLVNEIVLEVEKGNYDLSVLRLQVSQNFQRVRWYPEPVHRVFPKGSVIKNGHTTNRHDDAKLVMRGFLWDCTNIFRDNWKDRIKQQSVLWNENPQYRAVPIHFNQNILVDDIDKFLSQPHWTWNFTPLNIPDILKPLLGTTKYNSLVK